MVRSTVRRPPPKRAVKVKSVYSSYIGRPCKKKRRLDINAPVGDFSPMKPGESYRYTVDR